MGGYLRGMERAPRTTGSGRGHVHTLRRIVPLNPLIVLAAVVGLGLLPTTAPAAPARNLWVSPAPIAAADSGCAKPGYNTIQSAINAAPLAATIHICTGTYVEALAIRQPVSLVAAGLVTVQLPAAPANSATACDTGAVQ